MGLTKYYSLFITPKDGTPHNFVHDEIDRKKAVILEAKIGEPCYLCCHVNDPFCKWHRIITSPIVDIVMEKEDYICIETENTHYDLEPWRDCDDGWT